MFKFFIDRPVFSTVISIIIVLGGAIGLATLPIEQYPDIAPPTVMVVTAYTGASAETLQKSVIAPLEEAINGVENMTYMTSTATNSGTVEIFVYFKQGTDADMAAVNVQNRVSKATGSLPSEVTRIGVQTIKRQNSILKIFSIYSPNGAYDSKFLSNYLKINIQPQILRIGGVGELVVLGTDYSMRIWLKPDVMAQYGLVPFDVTLALAEQNIEASTGAFAENAEQTYQYTMKYKGRLSQPEEFDDIVIRALPNGEVLRLKDIASVEMGEQTYAYHSGTDGRPGVNCMVFQTSGSNATEVISEIDAFLNEAREEMPAGVAIAELMSANDFLFASIREVFITLLEAILLVVLIVFLFLQNLRSTLIPTIGIIVSLVGTFAFMSVVGFSINLLTLFALVLVIGTVVDNAIIVVEAVQARFDVGYKSSYMATNDAIKGISPALIISTLVFMAVFIPVSMMGGTSGTFYSQFGITMAVAVGISAVNALTLSPALCALMLKPHAGAPSARAGVATRFGEAFNTSFNTITNKYKRGVIFFMKRRWLTFTTLAVTVILLIVLMNSTKTGLVPDEDLGVVFVNVNTAPGSSLSHTKKIMADIEERLKTLPQIERYSTVSGYGMIAGQGPTYGMLTIKLKPWDDRPDKADEVKAVIAEIYRRTSDVKDASIFALAPPMITGYGTGNGFDLHIQDRRGGNLETFYGYTQEFIAQLNRRPEIASAYSSFSISNPQWLVDVDAVRCKRAGISPAEVLATLSAYYGGNYVSNFNRFSKIYYVMIQASPEYRLDPASLHKVFVRINGEMAPISQFVTLNKVYGAEALTRFNMYNSIAVNGAAADGYSSGDAIRAIKEVAAAALPQGYGYEFAGISREESGTTNNTAIIFCLCIVLIYLILCALYESFVLPLAVILSVPAGLMGSFLFAKALGLENNIYLQTGLIMLIGLLAKTAILITEYASKRRASGMSITASAVAAAKVRLRPILMTALCIIFGMLPLVFASGVGANGNTSLGTGAVGGMLIGTLVLLFLVPSLFVIFQHIQERIRPINLDFHPDWAVQVDIEENEKRKRGK